MKFNSKGFTITDNRGAVGRGPLATVNSTPDSSTHEGGTGYRRTEQSELFLKATTQFVGEDAFYEKANDGADRFRHLVGVLAADDDTWPWVKDFLRWLRGDGNIRTASILLAVEAVRARLAAGKRGDGNRELISSVLQRADEPGEMVAYWYSRYGRLLPKPIKRGIADAAGRLYNEASFLRYDSGSRGVRFGDVLELTHALGAKTGKAVSSQCSDTVRTWQDDLFQWAITARHNRDGAIVPSTLPSVRARRTLSRWTAQERHGCAKRALDGNEVSKDVINSATAGQWEWLLSWLGEQPATAGITAKTSPYLTKAQQWELVLPRLGYMALIRNLRNLDQAGISDAITSKLIMRIADPEQVARSRQLPFRFYNAYREAPSLRWGHALDQALTHSLKNVPELDGQTLILIDTSGSMQSKMSGKSTMDKVTAAALFGLALALKNPTTVDVWGFADGQFRVTGVDRGMSLLRAVETFTKQVGVAGYGTQIEAAVRSTIEPHHRRVCIFTDMQTFPTRSTSRYYGYGYGVGDISSAVPKNVPVYAWNLAGYQNTAMPVTPGNNRFEMGGLTDATFTLIPAIESGQNGNWPWQK